MALPLDPFPTRWILFKVLHDQDRSNLQAIIGSNFSALSKVLVDFKPLMGVLFTDHWEVCPAFEAFAKPNLINLKSAALNFSSCWMPFVSVKLLYSGG